MKRIILGISVLLILIQSGFAESDEYYYKGIAEQTTEVWKQIWRCDKAISNHKTTAEVSDCLKIIPLKKKNGGFDNRSFGITYLNMGLLYNESKSDKLKASLFFIAYLITILGLILIFIQSLQNIETNEGIKARLEKIETKCVK